MRLIRHFALTAALAVILAGCGAGSTPIVLPPTPAVLENATTDINAGAMKALGILHAAGVLVDKASALEASLASPASGLPLIPAALHAQFRAGFRSLATKAIEAIDQIERGAVTEWPKLRALLDPILTLTTQLVELVRKVGDAPARGKLWAFVGGLAGLVGGALPPGTPPAQAFALEGGR